MGNTFKLLTALGFASLLSGCIIPESFDAEISIKKDGTIIESFEGTTLFSQVVPAMIKKGKLSTEEQTKLKEMTEKVANDYKAKWKVNSKNRSYFKYKDQVVNVDKGALFGILKVSNKDNEIEIFYGSKQAKKSDIEALKKANYKLSGKIKVDTKCKVIESNANSISKNQASHKWTLNDLSNILFHIKVDCSN